MMQLWLDDIRIAPRARKHDPQTSRAAAVRSLEFSDSHEAKIVRMLKLHGPNTPERLYDFTGLSVVQIDRRRKEMIGKGLIRVLIDHTGQPVTLNGQEVLEAA